LEAASGDTALVWQQQEKEKEDRSV
jgi:hypothetical protein